MAWFGQRWLFMILLLGGLVLAAAAEDNSPTNLPPATNLPPPADPAPPPPRLANGALFEGAFQKTDAEGLVFKTMKGAVAYPWKYLARGVRYRYEKPFLSKAKPVKKAVAPAPAPVPRPKPAPPPPPPPPVTNAPAALKGRMLQIPSSRY